MALRTSLAHDTVTFERCKVHADPVVGEVELLSELLDGAVTATQQRYYFPACAFEKLLVSVHGQYAPSVRRS